MLQSPRQTRILLYRICKVVVPPLIGAVVPLLVPPRTPAAVPPPASCYAPPPPHTGCGGAWVRPVPRNADRPGSSGASPRSVVA